MIIRTLAQKLNHEKQQEEKSFDPILHENELDGTEYKIENIEYRVYELEDLVDSLIEILKSNKEKFCLLSKKMDVLEACLEKALKCLKS